MSLNRRLYQWLLGTSPANDKDGPGSPEKTANNKRISDGSGGGMGALAFFTDHARILVQEAIAEYLAAAELGGQSKKVRTHFAWL